MQYKMAENKEQENKIAKLQTLEQNIQNYSLQKQNFQSQLIEVDNALYELKKSKGQAYKIVGATIDNGTFAPNKTVKHTHEGSIGNLCNPEITAMMEETLAQFKFEKVNKAIADLVK